MKSVVLIFAGVLLMATGVSAQEPATAPVDGPRPEVLGKEQLDQDAVTIVDGKMRFERIRVCTVLRPEELGGGFTQPFQARVVAEAPADGFISRDNFLMVTIDLALKMRIWFVDQIIPGLTPMQAVGAATCKSIAQAIGDVDMELEIVMTPNGIVRTLRENRTGSEDQQTASWEQIL
ncbi:MAG: hypothetical protein E2O56_02100 [Gammaproteobacteria bacterium]|nr:MAG: hypothetical protein E2O56_02100 [Gammaproteobacteria bacterium]